MLKRTCRKGKAAVDRRTRRPSQHSLSVRRRVSLTLKLAHVLDSLVRVPRRVMQSHHTGWENLRHTERAPQPVGRVSREAREDHPVSPGLRPGPKTLGALDELCLLTPDGCRSI